LLSAEPVALLIEFDPMTGKRAGNISPTDPGLVCIAQDLESFPCREIRLVVDGRNVKQYEGISGVTIIRGRDAINSMVDSVAKPMYYISDGEIFRRSLDEYGIRLRDVFDNVKRANPGKSKEELENLMLEQLYNTGVLGIRKFQRGRKI